MAAAVMSPKSFEAPSSAIPGDDMYAQYKRKQAERDFSDVQETYIKNAINARRVLEMHFFFLFPVRVSSAHFIERAPASVIAQKLRS